MSHWLETTKSHLSTIGIAVSGVADGTSYQHILPDCRSVIVFANGGTSMWSHFLEHICSKPDNLSKQQHPLDNFVQHHLRLADPHPDSSRRWIRCAATESEFVDFRVLAQQANLGYRSHLGLLIHPTYGLWLSFRAAVFTTEYLCPTEPIGTENPCESCSKFCVQSCPGNAFTKKGWDVSLCANYHQQSDDCTHSCASRLACPVAKEHQHSPLQHHYHSSRSSGRKLIALRLGITDNQTGLDPKWKEWSQDL